MHHDHHHDHGHGHGRHDHRPGHVHANEPPYDLSTGYDGPRPGHADLTRLNRQAAAQLLPAAIADIEARAAQPLERMPADEFERHLEGVIRAAHAALFLRSIVEEGQG